jgi:PHD/YefM family antitoxin component YafN of YafNO toxin-antitoxin module
MDFYSVKDLRTQKNVWTSLAANGEVVITNNGKPSALMLDISGGDFESFIRAVRQARAMIAFNNMRRVAAENGYMTEEEIEAEIAAARAERRQKANG